MTLPPDDEPTPPPAATGLFLLRWVALAVLMGLGTTAVVLSWRLSALRTENNTLRTERDLAEVGRQTAQSDLDERTLLAEHMINDLGRDLREHSDLKRLKVTLLRPPAENADDSLAVVVWDQKDQAGLLSVDQLPPNDEGQDYQIWIADPAQNEPVNGGAFHLRPSEKLVFAFKPDKPITVATGFAITREKKGGSASSEGPTVLLGR